MFSQTAGSAQPSLNALKVKTIHFPRLSLDKQRRIMAYLDSVQARLVSLRQMQFETQKELSAMLPSVMDKAFKGEL